MKPQDYTRLTQEKITTKARNYEITKEKNWLSSCPSWIFVTSWFNKDEV